MKDVFQALDESTNQLIAYRDKIYDCCSDPDGMVHKIEDVLFLEVLDKVIDRNQALLRQHGGDHNG